MERLKLPNKIKSFAWRAYHEAIPTAAGKFQRKFIDSACCAACQSTWESVGHALIQCKFAKTVWRASTITLKFRALFNLSFKEAVHQLSASLSSSEL